MSDNQLLNLFQGIYAGHDEAAHGDLGEGADLLFYQLALSVRDLATRDPERVKNLLARCEQSSDAIEHQVVSTTAQSLIDYDYPFTRDALVSVFVGDARHRSPWSSEAEDAQEAAKRTMEILARDRLTPKQITDFNTRIAAYDPDEWAQVRPADPDAPDYF